MPRGTFKHSVLGTAMWLSIVSISTAARANTASDPTVEAHGHRRADELFREGQQQLRDGRAGLACTLLAESQRLDPALGTLLNLALCHQTEGKLATALREFEDAERWAHATGETARATYARERVVQLAQTVPRIRLASTTAPADLVIELDGQRIATSELLGGHPVDPGRHKLLLSISGRIVLRKDPLDVASNSGTIVVAYDEAAAAPRRIDTEKSSTKPTWGTVATAGGAVILTGSLYALLRAKSFDEKSQSEAAAARASEPIDESRKETSLDYYDSAVKHQTVGVVALGAGLVCLGTGLYLLLSGETPKPNATMRLPPQQARFEWLGYGLRLHAQF